MLTCYLLVYSYVSFYLGPVGPEPSPPVGEAEHPGLRGRPKRGDPGGGGIGGGVRVLSSPVAAERRVVSQVAEHDWFSVYWPYSGPGQ